MNITDRIHWLKICVDTEIFYQQESALLDKQVTFESHCHFILILFFLLMDNKDTILSGSDFGSSN